MFIKTYVSKFNNTFIKKNTRILKTWAFGQILPVLKRILRNIENKIEENVQTPQGSELWLIIVTPK